MASVSKRHPWVASGRGNWFLFFLSLGGVFVSWMLTLAHLMSKSLPCFDGSGCDQISSSVTSEFLGIPIAAFGLVIYLTLASATWYRMQTGSERLVNIEFGVSSIGSIVSLLLTAYARFVIDAVCIWCVLSNCTPLKTVSSFQFQANLTVWTADTLRSEEKLATGVDVGAVSVQYRSDPGLRAGNYIGYLPPSKFNPNPNLAS